MSGDALRGGAISVEGMKVHSVAIKLKEIF